MEGVVPVPTCVLQCHVMQWTHDEVICTSICMQILVSCKCTASVTTRCLRASHEYVSFEANGLTLPARFGATPPVIRSYQLKSRCTKQCVPVTMRPTPPSARRPRYAAMP